MVHITTLIEAGCPIIRVDGSLLYATQFEINTMNLPLENYISIQMIGQLPANGNCNLLMIAAFYALCTNERVSMKNFARKTASVSTFVRPHGRRSLCFPPHLEGLRSVCCTRGCLIKTDVGRTPIQNLKWEVMAASASSKPQTEMTLVSVQSFPSYSVVRAQREARAITLQPIRVAFPFSERCPHCIGLRPTSYKF